MNNTTTCPNRGNTNLCCGPAKWTDIVLFFLGNYAAHAATTRLPPGQDMLSLSGASAIIGALLFPASGVAKGLAAITSRAIFAKTDLQMAARSVALLMVVRGPARFKEVQEDRVIYGRPHFKAESEQTMMTMYWKMLTLESISKHQSSAQVSWTLRSSLGIRACTCSLQCGI